MSDYTLKLRLSRLDAEALLLAIVDSLEGDPATTIPGSGEMLRALARIKEEVIHFIRTTAEA